MTKKDLDRIAKYGYFSGYCNYSDAGYAKHLWWWYKPLWWADNNTLAPLTYHHPNGTKQRPNWRVKTDFGSVPVLAQILIPRLFASTRWRKTYHFHDSGYMERGLWIAAEDSEDWVFTPMPRKEIDDLILMWIPAEGGSKIDSVPVWSGVRVGGSKAWGKKDLKAKRRNVLNVNNS